ncbi:hypothetical protein KM043_001685 [Ampulex compressa]|nr:hypothetical protein KM043_001685 [Ampulex compressa]
MLSFRDLSGNDPALQLCAACCCCNISLGNTKACTAMGKRIAPYLIAALETLNRPLLEVCVWTIGNLVTGSQKAFEILAAQGCLKYLITLMRDCDDSIVSSVTYAIVHYLHVGYHDITEDEFIEIAQAVIKRDFSYKDSNFIWLLALVSSVPSCNGFLYVALPKVIDYLHESDVADLLITSEVTASVRILANTICTSSEQCATIFLDNPKYTRHALETLLNKLLAHQHIHVRKETLWLIGNLCNHDSPNISQTIKGIVPLLSSLKQALVSVTQPVIYMV